MEWRSKSEISLLKQGEVLSNNFSDLRRVLYIVICFHERRIYNAVFYCVCEYLGTINTRDILNY